MKIPKPKNDRVLVEPEKVSGKTASGLETGTEGDKSITGKIVAISQDVKTKGQTKVGERVLYPKHVGVEVPGTPYLVMREDELFLAY